MPSQLIINKYGESMILRSKCTPHFSNVSFLSALRAMSGFHGQNAHSLVPTPDKLQTLQDIDLGSFSASSPDSVKDKYSDSEDPFDPLDLVGLPDSMQAPISQSSPIAQTSSGRKTQGPIFGGRMVDTHNVLGTLGSGGQDVRVQQQRNQGSTEFSGVKLRFEGIKSGFQGLKSGFQGAKSEFQGLKSEGSQNERIQKESAQIRVKSEMEGSLKYSTKPVLYTENLSTGLKTEFMTEKTGRNSGEYYCTGSAGSTSGSSYEGARSLGSYKSLESTDSSNKGTVCSALKPLQWTSQSSTKSNRTFAPSSSTTTPELKATKFANSPKLANPQVKLPLLGSPRRQGTSSLHISSDSTIVKSESEISGPQRFQEIPESDTIRVQRSPQSNRPKYELTATESFKARIPERCDREMRESSNMNLTSGAIRDRPDLNPGAIGQRPDLTLSSGVIGERPDLSKSPDSKSFPEESPGQNGRFTRPVAGSEIMQSPMGLGLRRRSPERSPEERSHGAGSPFKKPRFNYPGLSDSPISPQVRSYFSQEQIRGFNTVAKERPAKKPRFAYPTIQLATQTDALTNNILQNGEQNHFESEEDGMDLAMAELERKRVRPMLLSQQQQNVIDMALRGKSLFFTGSAGTGKSVLLREMIKALKKKHVPGEVAVTASTGLAGFHIGGMTLHSFAGIGISDGDSDATLKMVRRNRKAVARWKSTKVLIVDEISMIDGRLFDKLDYVARSIRRVHDKPFGGIQVILCGDFYQLPPVSKNDVSKDGTETKDCALFAFESVAWGQAISECIILTEVFRQKGDDQFIDMLNDMRHGVVTPESEHEFLRLSRPLEITDGIVPTELYATRFEVEKANNSKLAELKGTSMSYTAKDGGSLPDLAREKLLRNFLAPSKLFLKENAQVMCIKNFDDTLVNGSVGKVIGFYDRDVYHGRQLIKHHPDISFEEMVNRISKEKVAGILSNKLGKPVNSEDINEKEHGHLIKQSQESLDNVFNFMSKSSSQDFESQYETEAESSDFLYETGDTHRASEMNLKRKLDFLNKLEESSQGQKHPLVRFKCLDGVTTRDVLVEPERWEITDDTTEEVLAYRVQLPLMLAWALSIHKSQGQTLSLVKVDLTKIFENGQAYVALSRASSREGLQVLNFRKHRVRCHQVVENFYRTLRTTEDIEAEREDYL